MNDQIVSMRELQRNYRKVIDQAKNTKQPVYLGIRLKPEVVILDVNVFEFLKKKAEGKIMKWEDVKKRLDWIASQGRQDVNLAKFIHDDRQSH